MSTAETTLVMLQYSSAAFVVTGEDLQLLISSCVVAPPPISYIEMLHSHMLLT